MCYGTYGNSQPSAQETVSLFQSSSIGRIRLYGPDYNALSALGNTGIEVVLGVPNNVVQWLTQSQNNSNKWIHDNVKNYPQVKFKYIVVGNGIHPYSSLYSHYASYLLMAMQNIQNAISTFGLNNRIKVTTAFDQSEIISQSFPPSRSEIRPEIQEFMAPIIHFLVDNNTPMLINLHPYFSYIYNKADIPPQLMASGKAGQDPRLDYAIFRSSNPVVQDGPLGYTNVFDAMVDSVYTALEKAGGSSLDIVVSEVGWPTAEGREATNQNAETHNNRLINHVRTGGTPKRPQKRIETYIFSMFDENLKQDKIQRHWGIFWLEKTPKYQINFPRQ